MRLSQLTLGLLVLAPRAAHATLAEDAERLTAAWKTAGLDVERRAPMFLEQGRARRVPTTARDASTEGDGCTSVALIATRGVDFSVRAAPLPPAPVSPRLHPERAVAGVAFLARCGPEREELEAALVEMRSARAALEVVVARGASVAPLPGEALLDRIAPPARPPLDPGRASSVDALAGRTARVEERSHADGAVEVVVDRARASSEGAGRSVLALREGCHRIELLSEHGAEGRVADLDAELRDASTNAVLARDRSDTPDARLDACLGEPGTVVLAWSGAPPGAPIVLVGARWPLPRALPGAWGPRARGTAALALRRRRVALPTGAPYVEAMGVSGSTPIGIDVRAGGCFLAVVGASRGESRVLSLAAQVEGVSLRDDGGSTRDGAVLTFCPRRAERVLLRVDARGAGLSWTLGVWPMLTHVESR